MNNIANRATDMINAIPLPAFLVAGEDTLADANDAFRLLYPQAQIGRSYLTVLRQPALVNLIEDAKRGAGDDGIEVTVQGIAKRTFRATIGMLGDQVLVCLQDMDETEAQIQMRRNFVADLSHELKTPLTTMSGILETSANDAAALEQFLPALSSEVDHMKRLVTDLLTLSRVEANERRSPSQMIVLQSAVDAACAQLANLPSERLPRIRTEVPDAPIQFQGDFDEIVRALKNLIENGLRYGDPRGEITVTGSMSEQGAKKSAPSVMIEICNDGPTVESHHIPRLAERFYRIDRHRSRDTGGSGLGLAIVKHVVGHHRGRLSIKSQDQKFCVTLLLPVRQDEVQS